MDGWIIDGWMGIVLHCSEEGAADDRPTEEGPG